MFYSVSQKPKTILEPKIRMVGPLNANVPLPIIKLQTDNGSNSSSNITYEPVKPLARSGLLSTDKNSIPKPDTPIVPTKQTPLLGQAVFVWRTGEGCCDECEIDCDIENSNFSEAIDSESLEKEDNEEEIEISEDFGYDKDELKYTYWFRKSNNSNSEIEFLALVDNVNKPFLRVNFVTNVIRLINGENEIEELWTDNLDFVTKFSEGLENIYGTEEGYLSTFKFLEIAAVCCCFCKKKITITECTKKGIFGHFFCEKCNSVIELACKKEHCCLCEKVDRSVANSTTDTCLHCRNKIIVKNVHGCEMCEYCGKLIRNEVCIFCKKPVCSKKKHNSLECKHCNQLYCEEQDHCRHCSYCKNDYCVNQFLQHTPSVCKGCGEHGCFDTLRDHGEAFSCKTCSKILCNLTRAGHFDRCIACENEYCKSTNGSEHIISECSVCKIKMCYYNIHGIKECGLCGKNKCKNTENNHMIKCGINNCEELYCKTQTNALHGASTKNRCKYCNIEKCTSAMAKHIKKCSGCGSWYCENTFNYHENRVKCVCMDLVKECMKKNHENTSEKHKVEHCEICRTNYINYQRDIHNKSIVHQKVSTFSGKYYFYQKEESLRNDTALLKELTKRGSEHYFTPSLIKDISNSNSMTSQRLSCELSQFGDLIKKAEAISKKSKNQYDKRKSLIGRQNKNLNKMSDFIPLNDIRTINNLSNPNNLLKFYEFPIENKEKEDIVKECWRDYVTERDSDSLKYIVAFFLSKEKNKGYLVFTGDSGHEINIKIIEGYFKSYGILDLVRQQSFNIPSDVIHIPYSF